MNRHRSLAFVCAALVLGTALAVSAHAGDRRQAPRKTRFQVTVLDKAGKPFQGYVELQYRKKNSNTHAVLMGENPPRGGSESMSKTDARGLARFYTPADPRWVKIENLRMWAYGARGSRERVTITNFRRPHPALITASTRLLMTK